MFMTCQVLNRLMRSHFQIEISDSVIEFESQLIADKRNLLNTIIESIYTLEIPLEISCGEVHDYF